MGRKKIEINPLEIHRLSSKGMTQLQIAKKLGVSHVTLARRMADLQNNKGILLKYRSLQTLELTAIQARILEAITPRNIKDASLLELVRAFHILKKAELGIKREPFKIQGLVAILTEMGNEDKN